MINVVKEYPVEPGSVVDFGKMMQKQIGHLKRKMEDKHPEVEVIGRVWY